MSKAIESILHGAHRIRRDLKSACLSVVSPHYESLGGLFERDWAFCDTAYVAYAPEGTVSGFFLTRDHHIEGIGAACFFGLSAGLLSARGRSSTVKLYERALEDANNKTERPLIWGTTISPIVYRAVSAYLSDFAPSEPINDVQRERARLVVRDRAPWGWPLNEDNPFALRGLSPNVRYSPAVVSSINMMRRRAGIFDRWNLVEEAGDRLLFLGRP